jgi:hypothetical protein
MNDQSPQSGSNHAGLLKLGMVCLLAVVAFFVYLLIAPPRSVEAYCETFRTEGVRLHKQWNAQQRQAQNPLSGSLSMIAGAPRDLADFLNKLEKVAPDDIEPDVVRERDAWLQLANSLGPNATDPLSFFAEGMMISFQTQGAEQRIDVWTKKNCPASTFTN